MTLTDVAKDPSTAPSLDDPIDGLATLSDEQVVLPAVGPNSYFGRQLSLSRTSLAVSGLARMLGCFCGGFSDNLCRDVDARGSRARCGPVLGGDLVLATGHWETVYLYQILYQRFLKISSVSSLKGEFEATFP